MANKDFNIEGSFFHATNRSFETFDHEHLGGNTHFGNTELGFYFLKDKQRAADFLEKHGNFDCGSESRVIEGRILIASAPLLK